MEHSAEEQFAKYKVHWQNIHMCAHDVTHHGAEPSCDGDGYFALYGAELVSN